MEKRLKKQIIIASLFFYIIAAIGLGFYFSYKAPPSYPVVPLVVIKDIRVLWAKVIPNGEFYDFVARIENPNKHHGTKSLNYTIKLLDKTGGLLGVKEGSTHILPDETKYIIAVFLKSEIEPFQAGLEFSSKKEIKWQRLRTFIKPRILIRNPNYRLLKDEPGFSEASGVVVNKSYYDFDKVDVNVALYDSQGEVLATGVTQVRTLLARSEELPDVERYFEVTWYNPFGGQVERIDIEAEANVFDLENFMKKYGLKEKFQLYYD